MQKLITFFLGAAVFWVINNASASDLDKKPFYANGKIEREIGYSQAIRSSDTLYISGSVGKGDMPGAIRQAYDKLKATLVAHGLDFGNVVKENVFTTDLDGFIKNKDVRKAYYGSDYPAATWVQVQRLFSPSFVVEVELTAVFPK